MKIYTKKGDNGDTSLYKSIGRFPKSDLIFEILGTLDELNAVLGFVSKTEYSDINKIVMRIQSDLFEIGTVISNPTFNPAELKFLLRGTHILEKYIDTLSSKMKPLKNFILPGGSLNSNYFHLARGVCRRLERRMVEYFHANNDKKSPELTSYVNRLSDLLFVLARYSNFSSGFEDDIWKSK